MKVGEYTSEYYQANKKRLDANNKKWATKNKRKTRGYVKSWERRNKVYVCEKRAAWRAANKEHIRDISLRYNHGINLEEYNVHFAKQAGVCAICHKPPRGGSAQTAVLAVDHNHSTGKFRGLLCNLCNRYLGYINEDPSVLDRAKNYIA